MKKKTKCQKRLKEVSNQTIDELEPLVKKTGERIINVAQEMVDDFISQIFRKVKNKGKENTNGEKIT